MELMTQSEYARVRKIPRHIVSQAAQMMANGRVFDPGLMDYCVREVVRRRIAILQDQIRQNEVWIERTERHEE